MFLAERTLRQTDRRRLPRSAASLCRPPSCGRRAHLLRHVARRTKNGCLLRKDRDNGRPVLRPRLFSSVSVYSVRLRCVFSVYAPFFYGPAEIRSRTVGTKAPATALSISGDFWICMSSVSCSRECRRVIDKPASFPAYSSHQPCNRISENE